MRNLDRNSDHLNGFLKQLELNVVGTIGGKASFSFPAEFADSAIELREAFANWARECEFFDGLPLQTMLKAMLRAKYTTGRCVLLFDDGIICDSGKVICFDGDATANIEEAEFAASFPAGWSQHQGLIKDEFGVTRGALVSFSQRGRDTFRLLDDDGRLAVWSLIRDAGSTWGDAPFFLYQNTKRINQVVSVPGVAASVGSIMDLEALAKYEMQTAKKSAQTLATVTQEARTDNLTDGLDPNANVDIPDNATAEEIQAAVDAMAEDGKQVLDLEAIEGAGTIYDILPPGLKMELLNPTHPNANVIGMVNWFKQCAAWANGTAGVFATGQANSSYSASLVEQAITWPMFEEEQQQIRFALDWMLARWSAWAVRRGIISSSLKLPAAWIRRVSYAFPVKREPDASKEQSAIAQGLKNCTMSLRDRFGADWREKLDLLQEELDYCRERGIPHPALQTVSGQIIDADLTPIQPGKGE